MRIYLRQVALLHSDGLSGFLCEESGNFIVIFQEDLFAVLRAFL